jgi:hypothetical protein
MIEATPNIIKEIIDSMVPQSDVWSYTLVTGGFWDVEFCDPLWIRPMSVVTIGGTEYTIVSVNYSEKTFRVKSVTQPNGSFYTIQKPFYFHGTPEAVNKKLLKEMVAKRKTPMIYLFEGFKEVFDYDDESAIERKSNLIFCFLDQAIYRDWDTDDFLSKAILPMMQLCKYFVDHLKNNKRVGLIEDGTQGYPTEFNIKNEKKETTFSDQFSGAVLEITIPFVKQQDCIC